MKKPYVKPSLISSSAIEKMALACTGSSGLCGDSQQFSNEKSGCVPQCGVVGAS